MEGFRQALARIAAGIVFSVVMVGAGCNRSTPAVSDRRAIPATAVRLAVVESRDIEDATEYLGTLKSLRSTTVQPQIDGQITRIHVKSGDRVQQGASLMQIDPRRQQAAVSSQEAERTSKEASVNYARQQQQRMSALYGQKVVSKQELEQADTALRTAEADLDALQAQIEQQQVQLHYYSVVAPTAGVVGDIPVRVGHQVSTTTVLTTLDQNEQLEVYVAVPLERAGQLKIGLPIHVLTSDAQETLASTTVSFISPRVDDQTQSVLVKGLVLNPRATLRSSQIVDARIVWRTTRGQVMPVTAVLRIQTQFFAFIAEDEGEKLVARQRAVKLGPISGNEYVVLDGIKPGERLVLSGVQKLTDGAPIVAQP
jgi:RND family efflux transporter MFP subunit